MNLSNLEATVIAQRLERALLVAEYERRKAIGYYDLPVEPRSRGHGARAQIADLLVALALRLDRRSVLAAGH